MDKFTVKKRLYAGLGDFARQKRREELKKKYGAAPAAMAADFEAQDRAIDDAQMPDLASLKKKAPAVATITEGMDDIAKDADQQNADYEKTLGDMSEDEEMQKWMAKQRG
jgi:hypothetical protein